MADVPLDPTVKRIVLNAPMGAAAPVSAVPQAGGEIKRRRSRSRKRGGGEGEASNSVNSANSPVIVNKVGATTATATAAATALPTGGGATSPGTMQQLAASHIPGNNSSKAVGAVAPFTATQAAVGTTAPAAANDPKVGGAHAKVTLVKSRKAPRKLVLAAAATKGGAPQAPSHKRKTAKKIKVSLSGLGRGLRRATTIRKKASKHTLEEVKKALVEAKLVKPDTKAPEDILRQMYADYMTLKKKAL
jgi:hypothetical protein